MTRKAKQPGKELDLTYGLPRLMPTNARYQRLCEEYVKDQNAREAALRAGWTAKDANANAYRVVRKYHDYIQWLRAHQAQANAKQIAIELEQVLQEIAKIAFVNEYDYLVFEERVIKGKRVKVPRRKRLDELTRDQMVAITVYRRKDGALDYKLRDKEGRLIDLAKHLGAFSEKIILEHRHRHLHAHVDLTDVPLETLEALEAEMQKVISGRTRGAVLEVKGPLSTTVNSQEKTHAKP